MKTRNNRILAWAILILGASFYVYAFLMRVTPSAIHVSLMRDLQIDARGLGILTALFYYTYTPMQLPAGLLIDRFGPRRLLTMAMLVCILGAFLFACAQSLFVACIARLAIGFGSSFAFVGALILVARWFHAKYFAFLAGIVQFMGSFGAIAGGAPIALFARHLGWRQTQLGAAVIGIILTLLFWLVIRDSPNPEKSQHEKHHNKRSEWQRLSIVSKNKQSWWVGLYSFSSWAPITVLAVLWGIPFISRLYGVDEVTAGWAVAIIWLGTALGSPLVGLLSNMIGSRRTPLMICSALGLVTSLLIVYVPDIPFGVFNIILFLFGIAASGQSLGFAVVQDITPTDVAGTAIGFNNVAVIMGGIFLQPAIGVILHATWGGMMAHGAPIYSLESYRIALSVLPLLSVLGLVMSIFFVEETHCYQKYV